MEDLASASVRPSSVSTSTVSPHSSQLQTAGTPPDSVQHASGPAVHAELASKAAHSDGQHESGAVHSEPVGQAAYRSAKQAEHAKGSNLSAADLPASSQHSNTPAEHAEPAGQAGHQNAKQANAAERAKHAEHANQSAEDWPGSTQGASNRAEHAVAGMEGSNPLLQPLGSQQEEVKRLLAAVSSLHVAGMMLQAELDPG